MIPRGTDEAQWERTVAEMKLKASRAKAKKDDFGVYPGNLRERHGDVRQLPTAAEQEAHIRKYGTIGGSKDLQEELLANKLNRDDDEDSVKLESAHSCDSPRSELDEFDAEEIDGVPLRRNSSNSSASRGTFPSTTSEQRAKTREQLRYEK